MVDGLKAIRIPRGVTGGGFTSLLELLGEEEVSIVCDYKRVGERDGRTYGEGLWDFIQSIQHHELGNHRRIHREGIVKSE